MHRLLFQLPAPATTCQALSQAQGHQSWASCTGLLLKPISYQMGSEDQRGRVTSLESHSPRGIARLKPGWEADWFRESEYPLEGLTRTPPGATEIGVPPQSSSAQLGADGRRGGKRGRGISSLRDSLIPLGYLQPDTHRRGVEGRRRTSFPPPSTPTWGQAHFGVPTPVASLPGPGWQEAGLRKGAFP